MTAWGKGKELGVTAKGPRDGGLLGEGEIVLKLDCGDGHITVNLPKAFKLYT